MLIPQSIANLLGTHLHALLQGFQIVKRRPLANVITILTLGITLTIPMLFWIFTHGLENMLKHLQAQTSISLYLTTPLSSGESDSVLSRVEHIPGVQQTLFISPEQGLAELTQQAGMQPILEHLNDNPLPAVIQVTPSPEFQDVSKLQALVNQLKTLPHVAQAKLDLLQVDHLSRLSVIFSKVTQLMIIILGTGIILIIGNTLHLVIHRQHTEIHLLHLLGASEAFIARPFLYAGMIYGFAASLLTIFFVELFLGNFSTLMDTWITPDTSLFSVWLSVQEAYLLIFLAITLGWFSAKLSVFRRLNGQFDFH